LGLVILRFLCFFCLFAYTRSFISRIHCFSSIPTQPNSMRITTVRSLFHLGRGSSERIYSGVIAQLRQSYHTKSLSLRKVDPFCRFRALHGLSQDDGDQQQKLSYDIPTPDSPKKKWVPKATRNGRNLYPSRSIPDDMVAISEFSDEPLRLRSSYRGPRKFPTEDKRNMRFPEDGKSKETVLTFLGTASCIPSLHRGVSCVALRNQGDVWLFDCGEGTQMRFKSSAVKISRITKIFITHMHGDHAFGLAGMLCAIGQSRMELRDNDGEEIVLDIYGPEGIRNYIRSVIQLSYSRVVVPHRIHELKNVPNLHFPSSSVQSSITTRSEWQFGERGGTDIYPEEDGTYNLSKDFKDGKDGNATDQYEIRAAPMVHTVPCVGFAVTEKPRLGSLKVHLVRDAVERNMEALQKLYHSQGRYYLNIYSDLKKLGQDESITFPDGTKVFGRDVVSPPNKGRKIVYMGDTSGSDYMVPLAQDCDVLIHEATNAYFPSDEGLKFKNYNQLEAYTRKHGHSTPEMAGRFAAKVNARQLVLTHFSPRYCGDQSVESMRLMWQIEDMAERAWVASFNGSNDADGTWERWNNEWQTSSNASNKLNENAVVAAWDFLTLCVPMNDNVLKNQMSNNHAPSSGDDVNK